MNKKNSTLLICLVFCCAKIVGQAVERCNTRHETGSLAAAVNPEATPVSSREVITIPVVVHIVWNLPAENISDEQILSQIEVLNEDFNAANAEIPSIPLMFQPVIGDIGFQFCLASKDPYGNATTGITRTQTTNNIGIGGTSAIHHTDQGGHDAWPTEKYLNIWVAKFAGAIGGVASFPGEGPSDEQGVEVNYKQFGTNGTATEPPYQFGRTCTHEIGHYFNLEHVWGPNINSCCDEDDGVADTPISCENYLHQCPSGVTFSCTAPDMWMNFMNYTDDACMAMFSLGQRERMYAALNQFRQGLLTSDGCQPVAASEENKLEELLVFGNPQVGNLQFEIKTPRAGKWQVSLFNLLGQQVFFEEKKPNQPAEIEISELPTGIYFLAASQNSTRLIRKLVLR